MSKTKTLNRHLVARRLSEAIHGGQLPAAIAAEAAALIVRIDSGEASIGGLTKTLVADSWASTARAVAAGARVSQLKAIAELEASLGLAPGNEVDDDTNTVTSSDVAESIASTPAWSGR
jgi:hypothetical protein